MSRIQPTRTLTATRAIVALALLFVLVGTWVIVSRGTAPYEVVAEFENAGQIVPGNEVTVGGEPVGIVREINLGRGSTASLHLRIDGDFAPLPKGTRATIRSVSLSSVANRRVILDLGPNDAEPIPDGGSIPTEDTQGIVDLDALLSTLDPNTREDLQGVVHGFRDAFGDGGGEAFGRGMVMLNPALAQTQRTIGEVLREQGAFEDLILETANLVEVLAARRDDVSGGIDAAGRAAEAVAAERESLERTLDRLPDTLRLTNTTLVNVRATLEDARPAIPEARPVARSLARLLPEARPVAASLRRIAPDLRRTIRRPGPDNDLLDLLGSTPALARAGVPVVRDLVRTGEEARPVVAELRPYLPDLVGGLTHGFGGGSAGYYDANGHFARIAIQLGPQALNNLLGITPISLGDQGARINQVRRCPGSAAPRAPDGSNPFLDEGQVSCDPSIIWERP